MRTTKSSKFIRQILVLLFCGLLCVPATPAQDPPRGARPDDNGSLKEEVTIVVQPHQVRFVAQKAVEQMQLQIFNPAGETVFDSGPVAANEINWPLQAGSGEALKSGLYAYAFSIKAAGAADARVRRGFFIVDRAKERDGKTDRLWVTSRDDSEAGIELTIAQSDGATVAGTSATRARKGKGEAGGAASLTADEIPEGQVVKQLNGLTDEVTLEAGPNITITPNGNTLTISATGGGNSAITELEGKVGIGTQAPVSTLDVRGRLTLDPGIGAPVVLYTAASGGEQNRYLELINSPDYRSASGLKAGGLLVADSYNFGQPGKNNLVVKGSVGIGTATPASELHIHGLNPFITFSTSSGANAYIQNAGGNLVFKPSGFGACCAAMVIQPNTGNVGIGTSNPKTKFQIESAGITEASVNSLNERAILALGNTIGPARYTWTLESGLFGKPGLFGIYNRTVNKSALEIDGNLLVSVKALQITGGADLSEKFDVLAEGGSTGEILPGMVVAIDSVNPGKLNLSRQAYDRRVAGVISGAGGVNPGMMLGQEGTLATGQHPVALSGRVYCYVDASQGAIEPGDLLTTSATPGHAMKVTDAVRAQGAIIGKAMTGLREGKGLVLVLVTLQ